MNYISEKLIKENVLNEGIFTHGEGEYTVELRKMDVPAKVPKELNLKENVYFLVIGEPTKAVRKDLDHYLILGDIEQLKRKKKDGGMFVHPKYLKSKHHMNIFKNSKKIDEGTVYLSIGRMGPHIYSDFKDMKYFKEDDIIKSRIAAPEIITSAIRILIAPVVGATLAITTQSIISATVIIAVIFGVGIPTTSTIESYIRYFHDLKSFRVLTLE